MARGSRLRLWLLVCWAGLSGLAGGSGPSHAFRIFDVGTGLGARPYYLRWDAAPRYVSEVERSLDGGLRYSLEGGSYEAFRDQLSWYAVPSVDEFRVAVEAAFAAWEETDPETGLGTSLRFVPDLATLPIDKPSDPSNPGTALGLNPGAEIDVFVDTPHWGCSDCGGSAIVFVELPSFHDVTLTSGVTGYAGLAISGADIRINPIYTYTLDDFRILLTHEIGHTIGLADAATYPLNFNSVFLDDDYDASSSEAALATLTNSFALEIDPFHPDRSPLLRIASDLASDPGLFTPGVDLLMESSFNYALASAFPSLQNDDFAGRQFLYPVPEPGSAGLLGLGLAALARRRLGLARSS